MKKIILLSVFATTAVMAAYSEHAYIYKDPRIMGMGGVNTAVGGYTSSVFSNPAGLSHMKKDHGLTVEVLGLGLSGSSKFQTFANDVKDAADTGQVSAISTILEKYSGEHFQVGGSNYSAVAHNGDDLAWSVGILAATDWNLQPHANGGDSGLLEIHSRGYAGIVLGASKSFDVVYDGVDYGTLNVGIGSRILVQKSVEGELSASEINDNQNNLVSYFQDKYEQNAGNLQFDIGVTYDFLEQNYWHPRVGLSILNLIDIRTDSDLGSGVFNTGSNANDNFYGVQPTTVNLGFSVTPEVSYIEHLILGVDYVDIFAAQQIRSYTSDNNDIATKSEGHDILKRLRLGASAGVVDNSWAMVTLNAGLYQSNYTAGVDLQLTLIKFSAATYAEEIGPEAGQLTDRRYMLAVGIGW